MGHCASQDASRATPTRAQKTSAATPTQKKLTGRRRRNRSAPATRPQNVSDDCLKCQLKCAGDNLAGGPGRAGAASGPNQEQCIKEKCESTRVCPKRGCTFFEDLGRRIDLFVDHINQDVYYWIFCALVVILVLVLLVRYRKHLISIKQQLVEWVKKIFGSSSQPDQKPEIAKDVICDIV